MNIFKWFARIFLGGADLNRYSPGDTFQTHECILCKHDPDASYCIDKSREFK